MTPEGRVKAKVNKALKQLGTDVWRFMPVQSGYGTPALDYLLAIRGRFVAIETKAPGKTLTPMQEATKAAIEAAGGIVLVVWDETSLALAMKIILALEYAPHGPEHRDGNNAELRAAFRAAHEKGTTREYVATKLSAEEVDAAVGGDHGASRKPSDRRALAAARLDDQAITVTVTGTGIASYKAHNPTGGARWHPRLKPTASEGIASPRKPPER